MLILTKITPFLEYIFDTLDDSVDLKDAVSYSLLRVISSYKIPLKSLMTLKWEF